MRVPMILQLGRFGGFDLVALAGRVSFDRHESVQLRL